MRYGQMRGGSCAEIIFEAHSCIGFIASQPEQQATDGTSSDPAGNGGGQCDLAGHG